MYTKNNNSSCSLRGTHVVEDCISQQLYILQNLKPLRIPEPAYLHEMRSESTFKYVTADEITKEDGKTLTKLPAISVLPSKKLSRYVVSYVPTLRRSVYYSYVMEHHTNRSNRCDDNNKSEGLLDDTNQDNNSYDSTLTLPTISFPMNFKSNVIVPGTESCDIGTTSDTTAMDGDKSLSSDNQQFIAPGTITCEDDSSSLKSTTSIIQGLQSGTKLFSRVSQKMSVDYKLGKVSAVPRVSRLITLSQQRAMEVDDAAEFTIFPKESQLVKVIVLPSSASSTQSSLCQNADHAETSITPEKNKIVKLVIHSSTGDINNKIYSKKFSLDAQDSRPDSYTIAFPKHTLSPGSTDVLKKNFKNYLEEKMLGSVIGADLIVNPYEDVASDLTNVVEDQLRGISAEPMSYDDQDHEKVVRPESRQLKKSSVFNDKKSSTMFVTAKGAKTSDFFADKEDTSGPESKKVASGYHKHLTKKAPVKERKKSSVIMTREEILKLSPPPKPFKKNTRRRRATASKSVYRESNLTDIDPMFRESVVSYSKPSILPQSELFDGQILDEIDAEQQSSQAAFDEVNIPPSSTEGNVAVTRENSTKGQNSLLRNQRKKSSHVKHPSPTFLSKSRDEKDKSVLYWDMKGLKTGSGKNGKESSKLSQIVSNEPQKSVVKRNLSFSKSSPDQQVEHQSPTTKTGASADTSHENEDDGFLFTKQEKASLDESLLSLRQSQNRQFPSFDVGTGIKRVSKNSDLLKELEKSSEPDVLNKTTSRSTIKPKRESSRKVPFFMEKEDKGSDANNKRTNSLRKSTTQRRVSDPNSGDESSQSLILPKQNARQSDKDPDKRHSTKGRHNKKYSIIPQSTPSMDSTVNKDDFSKVSGDHSANILSKKKTSVVSQEIVHGDDHSTLDRTLDVPVQLSDKLSYVSSVIERQSIPVSVKKHSFRSNKTSDHNMKDSKQKIDHSKETINMKKINTSLLKQSAFDFGQTLKKVPEDEYRKSNDFSEKKFGMLAKDSGSSSEDHLDTDVEIQKLKKRLQHLRSIESLDKALDENNYEQVDSEYDKSEDDNGLLKYQKPSYLVLADKNYNKTQSSKVSNSGSARRRRRERDSRDVESKDQPPDDSSRSSKLKSKFSKHLSEKILNKIRRHSNKNESIPSDQKSIREESSLITEFENSTAIPDENPIDVIKTLPIEPLELSGRILSKAKENVYEKQKMSDNKLLEDSAFEKLVPQIRRPSRHSSSSLRDKGSIKKNSKTSSRPFSIDNFDEDHKYPISKNISVVNLGNDTSKPVNKENNLRKSQESQRTSLSEPKGHLRKITVKEKIGDDFIDKEDGYMNVPQQLKKRLSQKNIPRFTKHIKSDSAMAEASRDILDEVNDILDDLPVTKSATMNKAFKKLDSYVADKRKSKLNNDNPVFAQKNLKNKLSVELRKKRRSSLSKKQNDVEKKDDYQNVVDSLYKSSDILRRPNKSHREIDNATELLPNIYQKRRSKSNQEILSDHLNEKTHKKSRLLSGELRRSDNKIKDYDKSFVKSGDTSEKLSGKNSSRFFHLEENEKSINVSKKRTKNSIGEVEKANSKKVSNNRRSEVGMLVDLNKDNVEEFENSYVAVANSDRYPDTVEHAQQAKNTTIPIHKSTIEKVLGKRNNSDLQNKKQNLESDEYDFSSQSETELKSISKDDDFQNYDYVNGVEQQKLNKRLSNRSKIRSDFPSNFEQQDQTLPKLLKSEGQKFNGINFQGKSIDTKRRSVLDVATHDQREVVDVKRKSNFYDIPNVKSDTSPQYLERNVISKLRSSQISRNSENVSDLTIISEKLKPKQLPKRSEMKILPAQRISNDAKYFFGDQYLGDNNFGKIGNKRLSNNHVHKLELDESSLKILPRKSSHKDDIQQNRLEEQYKYPKHVTAKQKPLDFSPVLDYAEADDFMGGTKSHSRNEFKQKESEEHHERSAASIELTKNAELANQIEDIVSLDRNALSLPPELNRLELPVMKNGDEMLATSEFFDQFSRNVSEQRSFVNHHDSMLHSVPEVDGNQRIEMLITEKYNKRFQEPNNLNITKTPDYQSNDFQDAKLLVSLKLQRSLSKEDFPDDSNRFLTTKEDLSNQKFVEKHENATLPMKLSVISKSRKSNDSTENLEQKIYVESKNRDDENFLRNKLDRRTTNDFLKYDVDVFQQKVLPGILSKKRSENENISRLNKLPNQIPGQQKKGSPPEQRNHDTNSKYHSRQSLQRQSFISSKKISDKLRTSNETPTEDLSHFPNNVTSKKSKAYLQNIQFTGNVKNVDDMFDEMSVYKDQNFKQLSKSKIAINEKNLIIPSKQDSLRKSIFDEDTHVNTKPGSILNEIKQSRHVSVPHVNSVDSVDETTSDISILKQKTSCELSESLTLPAAVNPFVSESDTVDLMSHEKYIHVDVEANSTEDIKKLRQSNTLSSELNDENEILKLPSKLHKHESKKSFVANSAKRLSLEKQRNSDRNIKFSQQNQESVSDVQLSNTLSRSRTNTAPIPRMDESLKNINVDPLILLEKQSFEQTFDKAMDFKTFNLFQSLPKISTDATKMLSVEELKSRNHDINNLFDAYRKILMEEESLSVFDTLPISERQSRSKSFDAAVALLQKMQDQRSSGVLSETTLPGKFKNSSTIQNQEKDNSQAAMFGGASPPGSASSKKQKINIEPPETELKDSEFFVEIPVRDNDSNSSVKISITHETNRPLFDKLKKKTESKSVSILTDPEIFNPSLVHIDLNGSKSDHYVAFSPTAHAKDLKVTVNHKPTSGKNVFVAELGSSLDSSVSVYHQNPKRSQKDEEASESSSIIDYLIYSSTTELSRPKNGGTNEDDYFLMMSKKSKLGKTRDSVVSTKKSKKHDNSADTDTLTDHLQSEMIQLKPSSITLHRLERRSFINDEIDDGLLLYEDLYDPMDQLIINEALQFKASCKDLRKSQNRPIDSIYFHKCRSKSSTKSENIGSDTLQLSSRQDLPLKDEFDMEDEVAEQYSTLLKSIKNLELLRHRHNQDLLSEDDIAMLIYKRYGIVNEHDIEKLQKMATANPKMLFAGLLDKSLGDIILLDSSNVSGESANFQFTMTCVLPTTSGATQKDFTSDSTLKTGDISSFGLTEEGEMHDSISNDSQEVRGSLQSSNPNESSSSSSADSNALAINQWNVPHIELLPSFSPKISGDALDLSEDSTDSQQLSDTSSSSISMPHQLIEDIATNIEQYSGQPHQTSSKYEGSDTYSRITDSSIVPTNSNDELNNSDNDDDEHKQ